MNILSKPFVKLNIILFFTILCMDAIAENCPKCGEGSEYPECFSLDYIQDKAISMLKGCTDLKSKFLVKTAGNSSLSYNERVEEKLMLEFCDDPVNNQGTACTKFHYNRIGQY